MLRTIDGGNVENCPYRQADIAHLVTTVEAIVGASWRMFSTITTPRSTLRRATAI